MDTSDSLAFGEYRRHHAEIRKTLYTLLVEAKEKLGDIMVHPVITGSGGLSLANHLGIPFEQEKSFILKTAMLSRE